MNNYLNVNEKFYLQFFAEEPTEPTEPTESTESTEPKEPKGKEPKFTDDDVNKLLERKYAEWAKKKNAEVEEAKKLAEMNAKEKAEYERDKLQKELDSYKEKETISEMTSTARKMLKDEGINISDDVLKMFVSTNADDTKAAVDSFAIAFKEAVDDAVKEKLKGEPPKRGSGAKAPTKTKAEILAIKDPELRQKEMLENRELFNF